ncbi:MAG: hypothetical protein JXA36_07520 [Coriobacteriia bacterium]|nr:hypothetical protein [Coriobacteriia bacterium]
MSAHNDSDLSNIPEDVRARLESLADRYAFARTKEDNVRRRMETRTARIRSAIGEVLDRYGFRLTRMRRHRMAIAREILALWDAYVSGARQLVLPAGTIRKRTNISAKVLDKRAVMDALDRLDRLDLVDEVVNERRLAGVVRDNRDKFPDGSVEFIETPGIAVYTKEDEYAPGT